MLMIDIETLGLRPGAYIPTIGWCVFDLDGIRDSGTFAIRLENWHNARADISTIKFWLQQDKDAIAKTFFRNEEVTWVEALMALEEIVKLPETQADQGIWSNGPLFDLAHLEYWYDQMSTKMPWSHRSPRDMRTLMQVAHDLTGFDHRVVADRITQEQNLTSHDAESDARVQALVVIDALKALRRVMHAQPEHPRDAG